MQSDRRGFFSGLGKWFTLVMAGFAGGASAAAAQTKGHISQIRGTANTLAGFNSSGVGQSVSPGTGLQLVGAVLNVTQSPTPNRNWNVVLVRDALNTYLLPASVQRNTVIHRNGLRQNPAADYSIQGNSVVPVSTMPWLPDDDILADGEPA